MLGRALNWCIEQRAFAGRTSIEVDRQLAIMKANAFFEASVVHCRNLVDFFTGRPTRDDVGAVDYLPSWSVPQDIEDELDKAMFPLNKRVFHVTAYRERVAKGTHDRNLHDVKDLLQRLWNLFLPALSGAQRNWFEKAQV